MDKEVHWWNGVNYNNVIPEEMIEKILKKGEISMYKTQKNKKEFIKPFKNMINKDGENSLMYIPKECIIKLQNQGKIVKVPTKENVWYDVNYKSIVKVSL